MPLKCGEAILLWHSKSEQSFIFYLSRLAYNFVCIPQKFISMTPDGYTEVQLLCSVFSSACFVFTVSILFTLLLSCCNVTV